MSTDKIKASLAQRKEMIPFAHAVYEAFMVLGQSMEVSTFRPKNMPFVSVYVPIGKFNVYIFQQKQYYTHPQNSDYSNQIGVRFTFQNDDFNSDSTVIVSKEDTLNAKALARVLAMPFIQECQRIRESMASKKKKDAKAKLNDEILATAKQIVDEAGAASIVKRMDVTYHDLIRVEFDPTLGQAVCTLYALPNVLRAFVGSRF